MVIANFPLESVRNKVNLLGRGVVLQGATIYIVSIDNTEGIWVYGMRLDEVPARKPGSVIARKHLF